MKKNNDINIKKIKFINQIINNDFIFITIYFIDKCNYRCVYCYNKQQRTMQYINTTNLKNVLLFIINKYKNKIIELEILGGEPTLHPDLYDFCLFFKNYKNVLIYIYSNFSNTINLYTKLVQLNNVFLDLTHHYYKNKINILFFKKILQFLNNKCIDAKKININYMLMPNEIVNNTIMSILNNYNVNVEYKLIQHDIIKYSKQDINYIYDNIVKNDTDKKFNVTLHDNTDLFFTMLEMDLLNYNFYGYNCKAGSNTLYIHCNGDVYPCQAYFEMGFKHTIMFNINNAYNDLNILQNKYIKCISRKCGCNYGIEKNK